MKIRITKNFLIFREEAKKLEKISKATLEKFDLVYLDFSKVEFISRSFLDELLNIMAKEKRIKIVNPMLSNGRYVSLRILSIAFISVRVSILLSIPGRNPGPIPLASCAGVKYPDGGLPCFHMYGKRSSNS